MDHPAGAVVALEEIDHPTLLALLSEHGTDVNTLPPGRHPARPSEPARTYQVVPLRKNWLRIGPDPTGALIGHWVADPGRPEDVFDLPAVRFEEAEADDLDGWIRTRADIDGDGRRWLSVLRRPGREAYAALVYDLGAEEPVRRLLLAGIYPDITLCADDASLVAFVEPDVAERGRTRAVVAPVGEQHEAGRMVIADSPAGGLGWRACSVRRFVKLSHGVRTLRVWDLVDVGPRVPLLISVPGAAADPDLFDVAVVADDRVLVQARNGDRHWELTASRLEDDDVLETWRAGTGTGQVVELVSGVGCALLRVREGGVERVLRVPLGGFSTGATLLHSSSGLFSLTPNTVTPSAGFGAVELNGGSEPFSWYWDPDGVVLNPAAEVAALAERRVHRRLVEVASDDGFPVVVDLRWRADQVDAADEPTFAGPVLLMVYGAYGIDIDLDTDQELGRWLDRGFAVGTPQVRGGGGARHLAGCRGNRDRSLADVAAVVGWLRRGDGPVRATGLCVLGASAGGFLAATTLNTCPEDVDACVVVNGFVDPLTSLRRRDTSTTASDQDEWGDPDNPRELAVLTAVSPLDNLRTAGAARALVVISGNDVRVNPRQGLSWYLRYRELGGRATLWFDPDGAHDCWGAEMDPGALVDWVSDALDGSR